MHGNTTFWGAVTRKAMAGLAVGTAVWIGLLLYGASLSRQHATNNRDIRFGPLLLHTIAVQRDVSAVRAGITVEPGLLWYAGFWTITGGASGLIRLYTKRIRC